MRFGLNDTITNFGDNFTIFPIGGLNKSVIGTK